MGNFSYRKPPSADELSGPPVDVSVADDNCPGCGGVLEQEGVDVAYVTDIPAMPRPQVTEYRVQVCRCRGCGRRVRGLSKTSITVRLTDQGKCHLSNLPR